MILDNTVKYTVVQKFSIPNTIFQPPKKKYIIIKVFKVDYRFSHRCVSILKWCDSFWDFKFVKGINYSLVLAQSVRSINTSPPVTHSRPTDTRPSDTGKPPPAATPRGSQELHSTTLATITPNITSSTSTLMTESITKAIPSPLPPTVGEKSHKFQDKLT